MDLPAVSRPIAERLAQAAGDVLGPRLGAIAVYGSAVDGEILAGYSDFDCLVTVNAPVTLADALALEEVIGQADIAPFTYYQPTFVVATSPRALLVPSAYAVLPGDELGPDWILSDDDLRTSGDEWLRRLSALLAKDAVDWSMTTPASRSRRARLHLTRVKPSLRALLVREGHEPTPTWTATWSDLRDGLAAVDVLAADRLNHLLGAVRSNDDRTVAVASLELLARICVRHLDAPRGEFMVVP